MCAPCFLHIPVFIVRLLAAVWFGMSSPTYDPELYAMLTIPIAFVLGITGGCLVGECKNGNAGFFCA